MVSKTITINGLEYQWIPLVIIIFIVVGKIWFTLKIGYMLFGFALGLVLGHIINKYNK